MAKAKVKVLEKKRGKCTVKKIITRIKAVYTSLMLGMAMIILIPLDVKATESQSLIENNSKIPHVAFVSISDYSVDGGVLVPGKDTTLHLEIHNISTLGNAYTLVLTVTSNSGMVYPSYGTSNQYFIGRLDKDEKTTVEVPLRVGVGFEGEAADIICNFSYSSDNIPLTNEATISLPASGGSLVSAKKLQVGPTAIVNSKTLLSVSLISSSTENITDAVLIVDGKVSKDSRRIQLETLNPYESHSEDCQITFTETGEQNIDVKLQYTDLNGNKKETEIGTYTVTVGEQSPAVNVDIINPSRSFIGKIIAGVSMLLACAAAIIYILRR